MEEEIEKVMIEEVSGLVDFWDLLVNLTVLETTVHREDFSLFLLTSVSLCHIRDIHILTNVTYLIQTLLRSTTCLFRPVPRQDPYDVF